MDVTVQAAWIGVVGTVVGGAGFKVIEFLQSRRAGRKDEDQLAQELRDELREDVANLRSELHQVEQELEQWRGKYYTLLEKFIAVKANLEVALKQIEEEQKGTLTDQT